MTVLPIRAYPPLGVTDSDTDSVAAVSCAVAVGSEIRCGGRPAPAFGDALAHDPHAPDAARIGVQHMELEAGNSLHDLAARRHAAEGGEDKAADRVDILPVARRRRNRCRSALRPPRARPWRRPGRCLRRLARDHRRPRRRARPRCRRRPSRRCPPARPARRCRHIRRSPAPSACAWPACAPSGRRRASTAARREPCG